MDLFPFAISEIIANFMKCSDLAITQFAFPAL